MSFAENNVHFAPNLYFDPYFKLHAVKVLPGEYFASSQDKLLVTVLGSCVAVCLRDSRRNISGMNHFLLPRDNSDSASLLNESARYGVYAMELLINHMLKLGASKSRLQAKVFGGANVLKDMVTTNIGAKNAEFVLTYLNQEEIPVLAQDLLGDYPRKVYFFSDSGIVKVKKIRALHNDTIYEREHEYQRRVASPSAGEVDLFID